MQLDELELVPKETERRDRPNETNKHSLTTRYNTMNCGDMKFRVKLGISRKKRPHLRNVNTFDEERQKHLVSHASSTCRYQHII